MLTFTRRQIHHDRRRIGVATILTLAVGDLCGDLRGDLGGNLGGGLLPDPLPVATEPLAGLGLLAPIPSRRYPCSPPGSNPGGTGSRSSCSQA